MFREHTAKEIVSMIDAHADNVQLTGGVDFGVSKDEQNLNVQTDNFDMNIKNNEITINAKKKENHTLGDLQQKLTNDLYNKQSYSENDIELIKILFENNEI